MDMTLEQYQAELLKTRMDYLSLATTSTIALANSAERADANDFLAKIHANSNAASMAPAAEAKDAKKLDTNVTDLKNSAHSSASMFANNTNNTASKLDDEAPKAKTAATAA